MSESRSPLVRFKVEYCENETTHVPKWHLAWWRNASWIRVATDHICRPREAVDEYGEQPEGQPNRLAMIDGVEETQR